MFIFLVVLSVVAQSLVALVVLQKNRKSLSNIFFFFLLVFLITWALLNFVITRDPFSANQLILYRLLMASVVAQNTLFFLFATTYPNQKLAIRKKLLWPYLGLSLLALSVALSPLLFTSVNYGSGGARPVAGPGILIFILHAAIGIILGLRAIYKRYAVSHGLSHGQFRLIFFGSLILWGIVPITNFVVSMATQTLFFARISPLYTLAFSSIIAYAIVAHKLFDIRLAAARGLAYLGSLGTMALAYGVVVFVLSAKFLSTYQVPLSQRIVYIGLALLTGLLFSPLKKFFDKLTNRIFFQEDYEPQEVLDELSDILVGASNVDTLKSSSALIIQKALKPTFVRFALVADEASPDNELVHGLSLNTSKPLITSEELEFSHSKLAELLRSNDVALAARLYTSKTAMGFILLGHKQSGANYPSADEKLLTIIADGLAVSLQNLLRLQQIEDFNKTLQQKVDDATHKLRQANERLKSLDETKDDFISMASHQLRTPLTSVKGYLSLVLDGDAGRVNAQQRQMLQQAYTSSQRMVFLIADLLNVSRLKTGKFIIDPAPVNLADIVASEMDQLVATASLKNLELVYDQPSDFPDLMLDETKSRQVIMNFIDNAIYYTPEGGKIEVKLALTRHAVEFRVVDNGIGVPASERHHLFSKFYRAKNAQKARPDGTGLGLFMAKKVIVAEGGSIIFDSEENVGSTFGFSFPLAKIAVKTPKKPVPKKDSTKELVAS